MQAWQTVGATKQSIAQFLIQRWFQTRVERGSNLPPKALQPSFCPNEGHCRVRVATDYQDAPIWGQLEKVREEKRNVVQLFAVFPIWWFLRPCALVVSVGMPRLYHFRLVHVYRRKVLHARAANKLGPDGSRGSVQGTKQGVPNDRITRRCACMCVHVCVCVDKSTPQP